MKNKPETLNLLNNIGLVFEENIGQQDEEVKYILKQSGCTTYFTKNEMVSVFSNVKNTKSELDEQRSYEVNILKMKFENSNEDVNILGQDKLKYNVNYFKGIKDNWITDVLVCEKIIYKDIYENIDLIYYSKYGKIEYDFILKENSSIEDIKVSFEGADNISIDKDNNLKIDIKDRSVYLLKPRTYQIIDEVIVDIKSEFLIESNILTFKVDEYDKSNTLIVDPVLLYSTYLGGIGGEEGYSVSVDENEIAYIVGNVSSTNFPTTPNAYDTTINGDIDIFLTKIDTKLSGTSSLIYSTYLGGSNYEIGNSVAVDEDEVAYITGITRSGDFPTTLNAYDNTLRGNEDAFLSKIDTKLSGVNGLLYSTYLGGNGSDIGSSIAIDDNKNVYITGITRSTNFPTTPNAYQASNNGFSNTFLAKIDTTLSGANGLIYSTYLGGSHVDEGYSVAVDENENAYITGVARSSDFPTTPSAYKDTLSSSQDTFLSRIDTNISGSSGLIYSTYIGGMGSEWGYGVAVDQNQNAYLTGKTSSVNYPTTSSAYQTTLQGFTNIYLTRIDTNLSGNSSLIYSTYIGKSSNNGGLGVEVDENQNAYLTGFTSSDNFPVTPDAYQGTYQGNQDGFFVRMNTNISGTSSLIYSTYIGGSEFEYVRGIAIDENENAYITGRTFSANFPTTPNAYQGTLKGAFDVFLTKMTTQTKVAKLQMDKSTISEFADIGAIVTYTITLKNIGTVSANNVILIDTIPNDTTFVQNSLTINGTTVPQSPAPPDGVDIGSIGSQDTSTITFQITVDKIPSINPIENSATSTYTYTVESSIPDGESGSDSSNITYTQVNNGDLEITKSSDFSFANPGETLTYTILFQNVGNVSSNNVDFTDTIPIGTTFVENSVVVDGTTLPGENPQLGIELGTIPANDYSIVSFKVIIDTLPSVMLIENDATSTYNYTVNPSIPNEISKTINSNIAITELTTIPIQTTIVNIGQIDFKYVVNPSIPIEVVQSVTTPEVENYVNAVVISNFEKGVNLEFADIGDTLNYTIIINNEGTTIANEMIFIDTIPNGTTFVPNSLTVNGTTISGNPNPPGIDIGSIGVGVSTLTFKVVVSTIPNPNPILNNSTIEYSYTVDPSIPDGGSGSQNSNTAQTQINTVMLEIDKLSTPTYAEVGTTITYTVTLKNTGTTNATNIEFTDTIPNGTQYINGSFKENGVLIPGVNPSTGVSLNDILAGNTTTVTFDVQVIFI